MERITLPDGTVLAREYVALGDGYNYYIDQGKVDGMVYVGSTSFSFSHLVYNSMLAWDDLRDHPQPNNQHPRPEFDRKGWVI